MKYKYNFTSITKEVYLNNENILMYISSLFGS